MTTARAAGPCENSSFSTQSLLPVAPQSNREGVRELFLTEITEFLTEVPVSPQKACCAYEVKMVMGDIPQAAHGDEATGTTM
jgi:hypothetical protein